MRIFIVIIFLIWGVNVWALELKSDAFENGGNIPTKYTCDSMDISPPLRWEDVPPMTQSYVIICDDPDAPYGEWVHWVIFNIPGEKRRLDENVIKEGFLEDGTIQGVNDFRKVGYGGPCPPVGRSHRYYFKLYALDTKLSLGDTATKKDILKAIEGHILAETKIYGIYRR